MGKKKNTTAEAMIESISEIITKRKQEEREEDIHRVAFNMPQYIYDIVNPKNKKQKITMTAYIMRLIRKDIGEI